MAGVHQHQSPAHNRAAEGHHDMIAQPHSDEEGPVAAAEIQQAQDHSSAIGRLNDRFHLQQRITDAINGSGGSAVNEVVSAGSAVFGALADSVIVIVIVLTVYFVVDMLRIRTALYRLVPHTRRPRAILIGATTAFNLPGAPVIVDDPTVVAALSDGGFAATEYLNSTLPMRLRAGCMSQRSLPLTICALAAPPRLNATKPMWAWWPRHPGYGPLGENSAVWTARARLSRVISVSIRTSEVVCMALHSATLCLLSLSRRATVAAVNDIAAEAVSTPAILRHDSLPAAPVRAERQGWAAEPRPHRNGSSVRAPVNGDSESACAAVVPVDTADIQRWQPVAESLVREGVTSKDPRLVATILAQRDAGIPPSTIGRHHKVHHTTVRRMLSAAQTLTA